MPKVKKDKQIRNYLPEITNPSRNWVFTQHLHPELDLIIDDFTDQVKSSIRYLIYQHEICPETGKEHWQGFIQCYNPIRYTTINKLLPKLFGAHYEHKYKKSTAEQASDYCKKLETRKPGTEPFIYGQFVSAGERTDLEQIQDELDNGVSLRKIAESNFSQWCIHRRAFAEYVAMKMPAFTHDFKLEDYITQPISGEILETKSVHIYGPSGIGKTAFALAHFKNPLLIDSLDQLKNINPEHDGLVFDDMSFKHIPAEAVIKLVDLSHERHIKVRYADAIIPKGMKRIFTHNDKNIFYIEKQISDRQKQAIERRVFHVELNSIEFKLR